jgi:hypothetical protein
VQQAVEQAQQQAVQQGDAKIETKYGHAANKCGLCSSAYIIPLGGSKWAAAGDLW